MEGCVHSLYLAFDDEHLPNFILHLMFIYVLGSCVMKMYYKKVVC